MMKIRFKVGQFKKEHQHKSVYIYLTCTRDKNTSVIIDQCVLQITHYIGPIKLTLNYELTI